MENHERRESGAQRTRRLRQVTSWPESVRDNPALRVARGRRAYELETAGAARRADVDVAHPEEAAHE